MTEIIEVTCNKCGAECAIEVVSFDEVPTAPKCPRCDGYLWNGIAVDIRISCQEPGCTNEPVVCRYPDGTETWYCEAHMPKHGFCVGCDEYWGGVEDFGAYRKQIGLCPDCRVELADELDDFDAANYFPGLGYDAELRGIIDEIEAEYLDESEDDGK